MNNQQKAEVAQFYAGDISYESGSVPIEELYSKMIELKEKNKGKINFHCGKSMSDIDGAKYCTVCGNFQ